MPRFIIFLTALLLGVLTPSERRLRGQIAVEQSWANTIDRSAWTAPARPAMLAKFADEVDPEHVLPDAEREASGAPCVPVAHGVVVAEGLQGQEGQDGGPPGGEVTAPTYNPPTAEGFALHRAGRCDGTPRWCEWCAMTLTQRLATAHEIRACGKACVLCGIEARRRQDDE